LRERKKAVFEILDFTGKFCGVGKKLYICGKFLKDLKTLRLKVFKKKKKRTTKNQKI
jgi:hypothetical protein